MTQQAEFKILTTLRSIDLTRDMDTKHLKKIATIATEVTFEEDEVIYNVGEIGKAVYIIQSGEVAIEMDVPGQGQVNILTVGPGELFGWSSLFPSERKNARARATKPSRAIAIDAEQLRAAWQTDHTLEHAIIQRTAKVMVDRIKGTRQKLVEALAAANQS